MRCRFLWSWAVLWSAACRGGADLSTPAPPAEVTVAEVRAEELAEWDEYQGEFEAIDAVEVRPRVSGYLRRVAFTEGKEVRRGDVLFEIDPAPYQAVLDQRRADLARERARLALVERDAQRGERLVKARAISHAYSAVDQLWIPEAGVHETAKQRVRWRVIAMAQQRDIAGGESRRIPM